MITKDVRHRPSSMSKTCVTDPQACRHPREGGDPVRLCEELGFCCVGNDDKDGFLLAQE